jgi:hypothetical protein
MLAPNSNAALDKRKSWSTEDTIVSIFISISCISSTTEVGFPSSELRTFLGPNIVPTTFWRRTTRELTNGTMGSEEERPAMGSEREGRLPTIQKKRARGHVGYICLTGPPVKKWESNMRTYNSYPTNTGHLTHKDHTDHRRE